MGKSGGSGMVWKSVAGGVGVAKGVRVSCSVSVGREWGGVGGGGMFVGVIVGGGGDSSGRYGGEGCVIEGAGRPVCCVAGLERQ